MEVFHGSEPILSHVRGFCCDFHHFLCDAFHVQAVIFTPIFAESLPFFFCLPPFSFAISSSFCHLVSQPSRRDNLCFVAPSAAVTADNERGRRPTVGLS